MPSASEDRRRRRTSRRSRAPRSRISAAPRSITTARITSGRKASWAIRKPRQHQQRAVQRRGPGLPAPRPGDRGQLRRRRGRRLVRPPAPRATARRRGSRRCEGSIERAVSTAPSPIALLPRHAGAHVEGGAGADRDRAEHHLLVLVLEEPQRDVAPDRGAVADLQQVPAAVAQVDAAVDVDLLADLRAQRAEEGVLEHRPLDQLPGDDARQLLHDPAAQVEAAEIGVPPGAVAADQQLLGRHRGEQGERRVDPQRGERQHRQEQDEGGGLDVLGGRRQQAEGDQVGRRRGGDRLAEDEGELQQGGQRPGAWRALAAGGREPGSRAGRRRRSARSARRAPPPCAPRRRRAR